MLIIFISVYDFFFLIKIPFNGEEEKKLLTKIAETDSERERVLRFNVRGELRSCLRRFMFFCI